MKLSQSQIEPYLSAYLMDGWQQDRFVLSSVDIAANQIVGELCVQDYFMPGDGVFHFAVPHAFIWLSQLAIIYACWEHGLAEKSSEAYLREINLQCRRKITAQRIDLRLTCRKKRYLPDGVFYIGEIDVGAGAFAGSGKFIIPLPQASLNSAPP